MTIKARQALLLAVFLAAGPALAQESTSAPGAKAYFIDLKDGDTVTSPVLIRFGLSGMGISPAGLEGEATANTGHHHLLVDAELKGDDLQNAIPMDDNHRHFGKGQSEASVKLSPGKHTLQLVLGDWTHVPHKTPVMSERITITVK